VNPVSCAVWGPVRADLDRVALAVARRVGREVFWVDIQSAGSMSREEIAVLQELDPAHAVRIAPGEIAVDEELGKLALWAVVHEDLTSRAGRRLADYLRIPGPLRAFIEGAGPTRGGVAIVVANAERATGFYTGLPGDFTAFLLELGRLGVSVVVTDAGVPRANVADFDVVLRVAPSGDGGAAEVFCSRADSRVAARFSLGQPRPIDEFVRSLAVG
jgi:hypothetical protein